MHKTMATSNATPPPTPNSMANFFDDDVTLSTAVSLEQVYTCLNEGIL